MLSLATVETASDVIYQHMQPTPTYSWPLLNQLYGCDINIKHENYGPTGSFKVRSSLMYMHHLQQVHGSGVSFISATRGNHGLSLAFAARKYLMHGGVVVPLGNSSDMNAALQAEGAFVIEHGQTFDEAHAFAQDLAAESNKVFVPAFDRLHVAGCATYAMELFRARPHLQAVFVPVGLGCGLCGLITARNLLGLKTKIYGVVAEKADAYAQSFSKRELVTTQSADTFAKGIAICTPNHEALSIIMSGAEDIISVSDDEIAEAMREIHRATHTLCEPAAGATLAALAKNREDFYHQRVALIYCGQNVDRELALQVLNGRTPAP